MLLLFLQNISLLFQSEPGITDYKAHSPDRYHRSPFRPPSLPLTATRTISHRQQMMSADGFANENSIGTEETEASVADEGDISSEETDEKLRRWRRRENVFYVLAEIEE